MDPNLFHLDWDRTFEVPAAARRTLRRLYLIRRIRNLYAIAAVADRIKRLYSLHSTSSELTALGFMEAE
jgi:hypothetical protein